MSNGTKKRILVIDDERDFCRIVKMNLELTNNFQVAFATEGKEGIRLAKETKPDLILCDMLMPGMSGAEVVGELKKENDTAAIPVVMLTAKADEAFMAQIGPLCGGDYAIKPIDIKALKAKIEAVLQRKGV